MGTLCDQCVPTSRCSAVGGYCNEPNECICKVGYGGAHCQTDLMPCERQMPCRNGATCTNDGSGGYICICQPGWEGMNCDRERNECASNPCQNGATCTDQFNAYICTCANGYEGTNCQTNINDCTVHSVVCENGGTCQVDLECELEHAVLPYTVSSIIG